MSTTDALGDPLAAALAEVLTVPLVQLYAALWRVGVVEILQTQEQKGAATGEAAHPDSRYASRRSASSTALALLLADRRRNGSARPPRVSPHRPLPVPVPSRRAQAVYSPAAG